jgi:hypothetical protein
MEFDGHDKNLALLLCLTLNSKAKDIQEYQQVPI